MKKTIVYDGEQISSHEKDGYEVIRYPTAYPEFVCSKIEIKQKNKETAQFIYPYPSICVVIKGEGSAAVKASDSEDFKVQQVKEGDSVFFLPDKHIKFNSLCDEFVVYLSTSQSL